MPKSLHDTLDVLLDWPLTSFVLFGVAVLCFLAALRNRVGLYAWIAGGLVLLGVILLLSQNATWDARNFAAKAKTWHQWHAAFLCADAANYPSYGAEYIGIILKPNESCYLGASGVIHGRTGSHQLQTRTDAGLGFGGLKIGGSKTDLRTCSEIRYDKKHPGSLVVFSSRVCFISPPEVFLEIPATDIESVVFHEDYVMMKVKTAAASDVVAFRVMEPPSWLFAAAITRVALDQAATL